MKVQTSGGSPISSYEYDALSRRIEQKGSQLVYSAGWHVIEERNASTGGKQAQYLWSPVYVDAMILRDRDSDANGTLDQRTLAPGAGGRLTILRHRQRASMATTHACERRLITGIVAAAVRAATEIDGSRAAIRIAFADARPVWNLIW